MSLYILTEIKSTGGKKSMRQAIKRTSAFHEQLTPSNAVTELFIYLIVQVIIETYSRQEIDGGTQ